jgi:hypothetical protein
VSFCGPEFYGTDGTIEAFAWDFGNRGTSAVVRSGHRPSGGVCVLNTDYPQADSLVVFMGVALNNRTTDTLFLPYFGVRNVFLSNKLPS